ncbi:hypothetical protein E2562_033527 [Oryza meyeriana var. granulata]|uniref:Protein kinase domain-containing protein n=1 Tax=Oryza meyeriana var. granulata TaxID=110450 RepID=A0A6G1CLK3_9ORYZ|nr:hypothetical protein E2562_033527 [Oryza meyeriana var. granulata]
MTKSFDHTLGKGGYGTVYKGSLPDGSEIAVKILEDLKDDGEDFVNEVLCKPKESKISIGGARGTIGYMAPEVFWGHHGAVTTKSDVYSYGMLILQMVGARENVKASTETGSRTKKVMLYAFIYNGPHSYNDPLQY